MMTTKEYAKLWDGIDRATDPQKSPLMRTRHKAHLLTIMCRLAPGKASLVSRQIDRINAVEFPLKKHYERMEIVTALLEEVDHDS